jgi:hypothetical protein
MKTIAIGPLDPRLVESPSENIGFAIAKLRSVIARHRIKSKNFLFGLDCLMDRFLNCSNKYIAEKR